MPVGADSNAAMKIEDVNTSSLERLVGYNSKRVSFAVMNALTSKLGTFGLHSPVDYSVLNLVGHNPGITSRQLCHVLGIYPPNLVGIVKAQEMRGLMEKRLHLSDRRAQGLYLTAQGWALHSSAEAVVTEVDIGVTQGLSAPERAQLNSLLRKVYASTHIKNPC